MKHEVITNQNNISESAEAIAERRLDALLEDPENAFLTQHAQNIELIESAATAQDALEITESLIQKRLIATLEVRMLGEVEGVEVTEIDPKGVVEMVSSIKENRQHVGEGGDAFVVMDATELHNLPPEICYKFSKEAKTPRGRNTLTQEALMQEAFYDASKELEGSKFAVPAPLFTVELGQDKLLAMEKLPAKSLQDIIDTKGFLPEWLNIDLFCEELENFIRFMQERGLYHRDFHPGNIMIRQSIEEPEDGIWGYMIDFGLSGYGVEGLDPYEKQVAGQKFTYSNDYGIIRKAKSYLKSIQSRPA